MDDRTLIMCAATLCVVAIPLAHVLETNASGSGRGALQVASGSERSSVLPVLSLLGGHASQVLTGTRTLLQDN